MKRLGGLFAGLFVFMSSASAQITGGTGVESIPSLLSQVLGINVGNPYNLIGVLATFSVMWISTYVIFKIAITKLDDGNRGGFNSTIDEAESNYDEREQEIIEEKQEVREDAEEQRSTLRSQKQSLVSARADRLDEIEEVHVEFSNDVVEYVEEQAEGLEDLFITLSSLGNMRESYTDTSVVETMPGSPELSQDQQAISQDIDSATNAIASRALTRIDYLEDAVDDYASVAEFLPDILEEQDPRVGERMDEVTGLYEGLGLNDIEGDDYGITALEKRVQSHVESITGNDYDAVEEFREHVESMARMP